MERPSLSLQMKGNSFSHLFITIKGIYIVVLCDKQQQQQQPTQNLTELKGVVNHHHDMETTDSHATIV